MPLRVWAVHHTRSSALSATPIRTQTTYGRALEVVNWEEESEGQREHWHEGNSSGIQSRNLARFVRLISLSAYFHLPQLDGTTSLIHHSHTIEYIASIWPIDLVVSQLP